MKHYLSGHMYRNSPYETDDSCGNCDGAMCETCVEVWEVADTSYFTLAEAQEAEAALQDVLIRPSDERITDKDWNWETRGICERLNTAYLTPSCDLVLLITFYLDYYVDGKRYIEVEVLINPEHPSFQHLYDQAVRNQQRYLRCCCADKDEEIEHGSCRKLGCTDSSCFREMERGTRKEKKWYM